MLCGTWASAGSGGRGLFSGALSATAGLSPAGGASFACPTVRRHGAIRQNKAMAAKGMRWMRSGNFAKLMWITYILRGGDSYRLIGAPDECGETFIVVKTGPSIFLQKREH